MKIFIFSSEGKSFADYLYFYNFLNELEKTELVNSKNG